VLWANWFREAICLSIERLSIDIHFLDSLALSPVARLPSFSLY